MIIFSTKWHRKTAAFPFSLPMRLEAPVVSQRLSEVSTQTKRSGGQQLPSQLSFNTGVNDTKKSRNKMIA
jgi:hypothetical protein